MDLAGWPLLYLVDPAAVKTPFGCIWRGPVDRTQAFDSGLSLTLEHPGTAPGSFDLSSESNSFGVPGSLASVLKAVARASPSPHSIRCSTF